MAEEVRLQVCVGGDTERVFVSVSGGVTVGVKRGLRVGELVGEPLCVNVSDAVMDPIALPDREDDALNVTYTDVDGVHDCVQEKERDRVLLKPVDTVLVGRVPDAEAVWECVGVRECDCDAVTDEALREDE